MANCPKCVIDAGRAKQAAKHLQGATKNWLKVIDELHDPAKSPVPLTEEEEAQIIVAAQTWCDLSDTINATIKATDDALCTIAVAHSHGGEHHAKPGAAT